MLLDALRVIQQYTTAEVTVPAEVTRRELVDIVETATLLAGGAATADMHRSNPTFV